MVRKRARIPKLEHLEEEERVWLLDRMSRAGWLPAEDIFRLDIRTLMKLAAGMAASPASCNQVRWVRMRDAAE